MGTDQADACLAADAPPALRSARYIEVRAAIDALLDGEDDWIAAMSTVASELHRAFGHYDWTGFYRHVGGRMLVIGPYQGGHGCLRIPFERGVCGAAARTRRTQLVPDVEAFPGHIACSGTTRSEIVVPVLTPDGRVLAVLDVDSDLPDAFTAAEDQAALESLCAMLGDRFARFAPPETDAAADWIARLGLQPHPEGGAFRETWRGAAYGAEGGPAPLPQRHPPDGARGAGTAIYFLLRAGEQSRWHRVDSAELWLFHAGDPLELRIWTGEGAVETHVLGLDVAAGQSPQLVIPPGAWQAARPLGAYTLAGCTVSPAFLFERFELAPEGWEPPVGGGRAE